MEEEFIVLAKSFARQKAASPAGAPDAVFLIGDFANLPATFNSYSMQNVPILVAYGPTSGGHSHSATKFPPNSQYPGEQDAENMALFVREHTDYTVKVYRSPWKALLTLGGFLAGVGAMVWFFGPTVLAAARFVLSHKGVWLLASLSIYFIAVAGVLYDIIRGVPWIGYDGRTRKPVIFSNQSGSQYGLEGALIGALNLGCGLAAVVGTRMLPKLTGKQYGGIPKEGLVVAAMLLFGVCYSQIVNLYRWVGGGRGVCSIHAVPASSLTPPPFPFQLQKRVVPAVIEEVWLSRAN